MSIIDRDHFEQVSNKIIETIRNNIYTHGFHLYGVNGDEYSLPYAYTVGLSTKGLPELICFSKSLETAVQIVSEYGNLLIHDIESTLREGAPKTIMESDSLVLRGFAGQPTKFKSRYMIESITLDAEFMHVLTKYALAITDKRVGLQEYPEFKGLAIKNIIISDVNNLLPDSPDYVSVDGSNLYGKMKHQVSIEHYI